MKKKILILDDDRCIPEIYKNFLEGSTGTTVIPSHNLHEALELSRRHKFSLFLVDKNLNPGSGFDFIRLTREAGIVDTPVIMMTGEPDINSMAIAQSLGVARFLTKPFDLELLLESIRDVLDKE